MDARAALAELEVRHLHCIESADFGLRHIRPEPVPNRWERVQSGTAWVYADAALFKMFFKILVLVLSFG